ncbi:MAG: flagellar motor switch protein FliG [Peptostreptococcaceae bacterium]
MIEETLIKSNAYDLGDIYKKNKISGIRKTAILLMTLGNEAASEIIKKLPDRQIQKIGVEIANIKTITASERREILLEFAQMKKKKEFILEGGLDFAESLINGALGSQKADKLLEGIKYDTYTKIFTSARKADANQILNCIQDESSQTVAIILAHIQPEKSAQILCKLNNEFQQDVAFKLANISSISPAVIKVVDVALERKLLSLENKEIDNSTGVDSLVGILSKVDRKTEKNIINFLEVRNNSIAQQVKNNMFVFEDIAKLEPRMVQRILREVNVRDIAIALKNSTEDVAGIIFNNQSQRASQALKEEIDLLGPVKVSQIEEAQHNIVSIIRRLELEGTIEIVRGNEDEFVV